MKTQTFGAHNFSTKWKDLTIFKLSLCCQILEPSIHICPPNFITKILTPTCPPSPDVTEAKSILAVVRAHQHALKACPPSSALLSQWMNVNSHMHSRDILWQIIINHNCILTPQIPLNSSSWKKSRSEVCQKSLTNQNYKLLNCWFKWWANNVLSLCLGKNLMLLWFSFDSCQTGVDLHKQPSL